MNKNREQLWEDFQDEDVFKNAGNDSFSAPINPLDAYIAGRKKSDDEIALLRKVLKDSKELPIMQEGISLKKEIQSLKDQLAKKDEKILWLRKRGLNEAMGDMKSCYMEEIASLKKLITDIRPFVYSVKHTNGNFVQDRWLKSTEHLEQVNFKE